MPVVEGSELINDVNDSGDLTLRVVSHDLVSCALSRDLGVLNNLAVDKAGQVGSQSAIGNGFIARIILTIELEVGTSKRVVGVIENRVVVLRLGGPLLALRVGDILQVVERTIVDNVVQTLLLHTTQDVVESTVFQENPDNVLDLALQVGNRLLRARLVAEGRVSVALLHGRTQGAAGQAEQGNESGGLHCACRLCGRESWTEVNTKIISSVVGRLLYLFCMHDMCIREIMALGECIGGN